MDFSKGGERFTATNVSLGALVLTAYNITVRQLSGSAGFPPDTYDILRTHSEHSESLVQPRRVLDSRLGNLRQPGPMIPRGPRNYEID